MKVQRIQVRGQVSWIVVGNNFMPIAPITDYLQYLRALGKSPNTIKNYAYHLKLFWDFLNIYSLDWTECWERELAEFMLWLRLPDSTSSVPSIAPQTAKRTESTINTIMTVIYQFYEFHYHNSKLEYRNIYQYKPSVGRKYKSFLHELKKDRTVKHKRLKMKEPRKLVTYLSKQQVNTLIEACSNLRDKFLLLLLYQTGMRIGEALGLRHEDMHSEMGLNEIHIVPRHDNRNNTRTKGMKQRIISVNRQTIQAYENYILADDYPDIDSDYVFINIQKGVIGSPLRYSTVQALFLALYKKTGIKATAHVFRHTHVSELIRGGMDLIYIKERIGHSDIQTTVNTYGHLLDADVKKAYFKYLESKEEN